MESKNTFQNGMNLDINPLNQPKNSYREAQNLRVISDVAGSSVSINNIIGNELNITIPDTTEIQKITITGDDTSQLLDINGESGGAFDTTGMNPQDLYNFIVNSGAYTLLNTEYTIYYGNSYLVIIPNLGFTATIIPTGSGLTLDSSFVPAQTNLEIIGSTTIREDIYLFTTNNTTRNPGGHDPSNSTVDSSSVGQIWKYTYDKVTLIGTLTLIYNNYTDFSTYWCITPTAALGRYENLGTQRIYWTDNFNKLRSLNVADPMSLALDISLLDIKPAVDFDIPILTDIRSVGGASVPVGAYQCAYRLKNTGGAVTSYSELSNIVYVVPSDEAANIGGNNFKDYVGANAGTVANKRITWTVNNLDTDFDRIEIIILSRDSVDAVPIIFNIIDDPLTSDSYTFSYDGTQDEFPVTLTEFLASSGAFTHCKTIGTKDNRLFAANVRNQYSEIEYDARAFRAKTSGADDIYLTNSGVETLYNSTTAQALGETEDTINNYASVNAGYYKPGSSTLGGLGANISYEFYTIASACDRDTNASGPFGIPDGVGAPWRSTNPNYTTNSITLNVSSPTNTGSTELQEYTTLYSGGLINAGIKYPPVNSLLRGFQRNEIYRFGIQFYDKSKNPYFVKWIGDIKMPNFFDINNNSFFEDGTPTGEVDFRLSFVANHSGAYDECFVQSLGIKFTVNIPADLTNLIDGYTIVRVKREEEDKTIVSTGYTTRSNYGPDGEIYTTSPFTAADGNTPDGATDGEKGFYITPDICNNSLTVPSSGMTLNVRGRVNNVNTDASISFGGDPYYMYKMYNWNVESQTPKNIQQMTLMGFAGETVDLASGIPVNNYDYDAPGADTTVSQSVGNPAYYFDLAGGGISYGTILNSKYFVTIERTVTNQYGGSTYTARTNNEYMSCSHFRPIRTSVIAISDTFEVFGGDIFVNMYDSCRWSKNWGTSGRGVSPNGKFTTTFYVPLESVVNTDLRHGTYMNKSFAGSPYETPGQDFVETYEYNSVYSTENNVRIYYPKPDPFVSNQEFDTRFYASEIKINGEFVDSWGIFLTNNYWDTEGIYGPINAMTILKDKMYFWQNRAIGIMSINPRVLITDQQNGTDLQLGTGNVLQRHDYLSTEVGLQHQWGMTKSSYKLFWLDVKNKKFYCYSPGEAVSPESDIKGLFSYFNDNLKYNVLTIDKPVYQDDSISAPIGINGVRCVYDFKYNQAIFTVSDARNTGEGQSVGSNYTFAFDERLNAFTSFYGYAPKIYFTDGYKIFSTDNIHTGGLSEIYMHDTGDYCSFYGTIYASSIKLVSNDHYEYTKVFDNLMWDSQATSLDPTFLTRTNWNDDTWNSIRIYDDYQNTDTQTLAVNNNIKRKERTWQLAVPRNRVLYTGTDSPNIFNPAQLSSPIDKSFGERIRDKYMVIELTYFNTNNRLLSTNNVRTLYRISPR